MSKTNTTGSKNPGLKPGDFVIIKTNNKHNNVFEGLLLASENPEVIVLKLSNGYNIGFDKKKIVEIKLKKKSINSSVGSSKKQSSNNKKSNDLPLISILHTGGTIASRVDYNTGAVSADFSPDELLALFPELRSIANINSRLVKQMMSENLRFHHYNLLAREVKKEVDKGVKGIIITHGTDTMHYTSAALSFILENLPVPVILVGAQRSSDRASSDAAINLICAAKFIAETDFKGVGVCMHKNMSDDICWILPGTKCRKMHTSQRDAFRPINAKPIAEVDYVTGKISFYDGFERFSSDYYSDSENSSKNNDSKTLSLKPFKEDLKIGLLKVHTNMFADEFLAFKGFDGLVVEGTALGHIPIMGDDSSTENNKILSTIRLLTKKMPVVMASQSLYGRINMNVYAGGRINLDNGVIGNYSDMTPETTFIKLAWLLSNYDKKKIPELITKNFRGEISDRIEADSFLL